jgi:hypothetical protein
MVKANQVRSRRIPAGYVELRGMHRTLGVERTLQENDFGVGRAYAPRLGA